MKDAIVDHAMARITKTSYWRLWLTVFLAIASPLRGAVLTVNQRAPSASDDNSGTEDKPLKTISAAASRVKAGDKVIIHTGEYRETVIIKASGSPEAPIVFQAADGEAPVIKGSDIIKGWVRQTANIWAAKLPTVVRRPKERDDSLYWQTSDVRQVFIKDGAFLDAIHLRAAVTKARLQEGNFFCDRADNVLYIWLKESENANALTIEASRRAAWLYIFGDNIAVRGLHMRHASTLAIANWPACNLEGRNIVLEDCQLTWGDFAGVGLAGAQNTLRGCTISCHGNSGIGGTGEGHVIENCRVTYNNIDRYDTNWHSGGAKLIPRFSRGRVIHSEFAHNIGPGLWLDDCCSDNLVEGNLAHDNEGPGIMVEISARNRVINNICFGNRNPLAADYLRPDPEAVKKGIHNIFVSVHRGGEASSQRPYHAGDSRGIFVSSSPESRVCHNTCYLNEAEGICVEGEVRECGSGEMMSSHDCMVVNNIAAYNKGTQLVVRANGKDKHTYRNQSDHNLIAAVGAVLAQTGWDGPLSFSLKEWQKRSGGDSHSVQADPSFVMGAMADFRLLPSSAAAGKGLPLPDVRRDFAGTNRGNDRVSIGACEVTVFDYPRPAGLQLEGWYWRQ